MFRRASGAIAVAMIAMTAAACAGARQLPEIPEGEVLAYVTDFRDETAIANPEFGVWVIASEDGYLALRDQLVPGGCRIVRVPFEPDRFVDPCTNVHYDSKGRAAAGGSASMVYVPVEPFGGEIRATGT